MHLLVCIYYIFIIILIIIIIHHDFLPQPKSGSHVKSDNTHTVIKHTPLSPYNQHQYLDFQKLHPSYRLSQPHLVTASHSSPGDNHQSTGGQSERTQGQAKMAV